MSTSPRPRAALGALGALGATALLLAACSPASAQRADNTLIHLEPAPFDSLYPPSGGFYSNGVVLNNIVDRLLYQDPATLELTPWIATDLPRINEDSTVFEFDIRTDVTYSDGTPLTASNVVANFDLYGRGDKERLLTSSEQISNYDHGEVVDEDTVRFYFTEPAPGFPQATSSFNAGLLADSALALDEEGFAPGNATAVIGSGPFVITDEDLNTTLTLSTREDYDWAPPARAHQGRASIDGVLIRVAAEEAVRVGALTSGQADTARQIEAPVEKHLEDRGITVIARPTSGINNHLSLRPQNHLLADQRVREAIIHGVDREELLYVLFSDSYVLGTSILAHNALGYVAQPEAAYAFDQGLAAELLDEAGWGEIGADGIRVKDGERLSLTANEAVPQPRSREVITLIQEQLREIGVELNLNPGDYATQTADSADPEKIGVRHTMVGRADYDVIKSEFSIDNRDELRLTDPDTGAPVDPELEALLQRVAATADEAERAAVTAQVQAYLTEHALVLPLFEEPVVYGVQPGIDGFEPEAIGRASFYGVSKEA